MDIFNDIIYTIINIADIFVKIAVKVIGITTIKNASKKQTIKVKCFNLIKL